ncbi:hypothetical protein J6352_23550 [Burkholderia pseudomallei]|uniref:hypothetical protein n=1 Tax=Burkholderia pseudomallei TaxID=28450 RepID=UPI001AD7318D|nr:hypothetical protein [Burkholderia pseudomallei]MBO7775590.1 hypothetical protein [Burkholderia pseudomallei]MBO7908360.1 hypothetical protein [Burkholderia pseudomallei]
MYFSYTQQKRSEGKIAESLIWLGAPGWDRTSNPCLRRAGNTRNCGSLAQKNDTSPDTSILAARFDLYQHVASSAKSEDRRDIKTYVASSSSLLQRRCQLLAQRSLFLSHLILHPRVWNIRARVSQRFLHQFAEQMITDACSPSVSHPQDLVGAGALSTGCRRA